MNEKATPTMKLPINMYVELGLNYLFRKLLASFIHRVVCKLVCVLIKLPLNVYERDVRKVLNYEVMDFDVLSK